MTGTCAGWIASLPVKPSRRAASASALRPFSSLKSANTPSTGCDAGGDRAGEAQRARELVGEAELAVRIIFGRGAERRRQILRAPAHRRQRRVRARDRRAGRTGSPAVSVTIAWIGMLPVRCASSRDVVAAFGLGQDDAVDVGNADQLEVVLVELAPERIDADPPLRPARALRAALEDVARDRLLRRGDAVLEVEDDRVGVAVERLGDLPLAVGGDEQPGARLAHCGFFRSSAVRVHSHTSSSRWLKLRCAQVTMPGIGPRLAFAQRRCIRVSLRKRVAGEDRVGEDQLVVAEVGDERAERRVGDADPDHQAEGEEPN